MASIAEEVAARVQPRGDEGLRYIWFYDTDIWTDAYVAAKGEAAHPMDMWQTVRRALSKSSRFAIRGRIRAASWSGREILHPRFVLKDDQGEAA